VLERKFA